VGRGTKSEEPTGVQEGPLEEVVRCCTRGQTGSVSVTQVQGPKGHRRRRLLVIWGGGMVAVWDSGTGIPGVLVLVSLALSFSFIPVVVFVVASSLRLRLRPCGGRGVDLGLGLCLCV